MDKYIPCPVCPVIMRQADLRDTCTLCCVERYRNGRQGFHRARSLAHPTLQSSHLQDFYGSMVYIGWQPDVGLIDKTMSGGGVLAT